MTVFKNEYTNLFIEKFHSTTNIDKRIIENLITIQLFHKILKNQNFDYLNNNVTTDQLPELVDNYQQRIEFIFASYPIVNPNFEIIPFDESSNQNRYILIDNQSKIKSCLFLHFDDLYFYDLEQSITLEHFIHLNIYDYFNYSLNLNIQEINQLTFFIRNKIYESSDSYIGTSQIKYETEEIMVIHTESLDKTSHSLDFLFQENCNITLEINKRLQTYTEYLLQIKNQYSNDIDKILERALLEQKMENF